MHTAILPDFPSGIVPKADIDSARAIFIKAGNAFVRRAYPKFASVVFHQCCNIVRRYHTHLLQGRAQDGKAVVPANPDIALAVLEYAVEFIGGRFIYRGFLRFLRIYKAEAVRAGGP